jgi:mannose-6-phosphate isomerase-like protein (cupin superfamily)
MSTEHVVPPPAPDGNPAVPPAGPDGTAAPSAASPGGTESPPYRPSPRPHFEAPTAIHRTDVTRHIWGDAEAGEVFDLIYASTEKIHALVFGLASGGAFRHSRAFPTVFGADEVLYVVSGTMVIANPQTGEVLRVPRGDSVFFRADTWHHVFAHGPEPLRILEFLAPPPAAGTTGAYARTREYLETPIYTDDSIFGQLPGPGPAPRTLTWLRSDEPVYRLEGDALVGVVASTEHLTVTSLSVRPGKASSVHAHGGDEIVYVTAGTLAVRVWDAVSTYVFELSAEDAAYVPAGARHEYRNFGGDTAEAIVGVAPAYLPIAGDAAS